MASYIGKVQIGDANPVLIGSTLYGLCYTLANTALKDITANTRGINNPITGDYVNTNYDNLIRGTTIHIKFIYGNTVTSNAQLKVGTLETAQNVVGNFTCPANTIISFTLDEDQHWVVNDNVDTNTEYVFKTAYNASTNKAVTESDLTDLNIQDAAHKGISTSIGSTSTNDEVPTAASVYSYVQTQTGGLAGLTGAMHFRGIATVAVTDGGREDPTITTYTFGTNGANAVGGDVVLYNSQEYVWTADGTDGRWELLGDEGSYALKSNTDTITEVGTFTANTLPQLTVTPVSIPNVTNAGSAPSLTVTPTSIPNVTAAGSATTASVSAGILSITIGAPPTLGTEINVGSASGWNAGTAPTLGTAISVGSASGWNAGTQASLTTNDTTVVVPGTT